MLVTLLGMSIDVREEQSQKASSPILVTPSGIMTLLMLLYIIPLRTVPDSSNM
jgi:hypothetical protein